MGSTVKLAVVVVLAALALAGCSDDEDDAGTTTQTQPATTTTEATPPPVEKPPFPETLVFSGDDVQKCLEKEGFSAPREAEPAPDDKVGRGIVHDRLLVTREGGGTSLRVFMFGSADLAKEQGRLVIDRSPRARILGTVILEPLRGDPTAETKAAIACLEQQAG